jgi:hypothetical protein
MFGATEVSARVAGRCLPARSWSPHRIFVLSPALWDYAKSAGLLGEPIYSIALLMLFADRHSYAASKPMRGRAMNYSITTVGTAARFTIWNCRVPNLH